MKNLDEVLSIISNLDICRTTTEIDLVSASGHILAEDIYSDINIPPFNKSAMDGYACRKEDLKGPLRVIENISAGKLPGEKVIAGTCSKIMTGAKIPDGANCVIMVEHTTINNNGEVIFNKASTKENICYQGEDVQEGDKVLSEGMKINPAVIAVAASAGKTILKIFSPPTLSIIATGDELLEPDSKPYGPYIRNSNSYNIQAQILNTKAKVNYLGICKDDKKDIEDSISRAIDLTDIVLLTGGVSMGDKDFVPGILKEKGLHIAFEKMAIQPGKPVAFAYGNGKFCFALSGNPVSSMLQFELLVKPFIYHYMGASYNLPVIKAKLNKSKTRKKTERMQFFPVKLKNGIAEIIEFHGSAHINGMLLADGLAMIPVGVEKLEAGNTVDVLLTN